MVQYFRQMRSYRTPTATNLTNTYLISLLNISDEDRTYQCKMIVNTTPLVITASNVTLDVTGITDKCKNTCTICCMYIVSFQDHVNKIQTI